MSQILSRINHPHDLKNLTLAELEQVAAEIRQTVMDVVDRNGGHLASNLGSVELTLALHKVYDFPRDRLVWDVSHQTYPHKLVTGRRDRFDTLRTYGGISGFCNKRESIFDLFDAGHAGTAVSLALGVAAGDYYLGERHRKTIAVVGDAAIAAGMAFEALNHAGEIKRDLMVILNDNRMSIANSVGALSMYLNRIRSKPIYQDLKRDLHDLLSRIPVVGKRMDGALEHLLDMVKHSFVPGLLFQELGFNYFGPVNGHNLEELIQTFEDMRKIEEPVLLHVLTVKGHGYDPASKDPIKYHAPKNFKPGNNGGKEVKKGAGLQSPQPPQYTQVFSDILLEMARQDRRLLAITAAMPGGTGLTEFAKEFPERYFDVGIAEQHGAAFSSGLAYAGARPVFAVYSTFCQRAYDQFIHDVCIQENSVIFCLDRAGLVGEDGWTHHGVFDISYMRCIPNAILMAPRDGEEFKRMFRFAVDQTNRPVAIRYPRSSVPVGLPPANDGGEILLGKGEILAEGEEVALLGYGSMVEICWQAAQELRARGHEVTVANARFAKPLDLDLLRLLAKRHSILITAEEHALNGGFGSMVLEAGTDHDLPFGKIVRLGVPDRFVTFGARNKLLAECGLDVPAVVRTVERLLAERESPASSRLRPDLLPADRPTKLN
ncbi:MAG: 1-deoxy-D-xylulose-5-phosphate synthase [Planctomycetes bacterium]|nr:1-deoxy-D-xylulose-5-phosphate synthase [Planctomycetota bacterium]